MDRINIVNLERNHQAKQKRHALFKRNTHYIDPESCEVKKTDMEVVSGCMEH